MKFKKPRMQIVDIFAGLFIAIGFIFLLATIHLLAISADSGSAVQDVLTTMFIVALRVFETLLIFAGVGIVIQFLRYIAWQVTTPEWIKRQQR